MTVEDVAAAFDPGLEEMGTGCPYRIYLHKGFPGECYWFWFGPDKTAPARRALHLVILQAANPSNDAIVWPKERAGEKPGNYLEMMRQVSSQAGWATAEDRGYDKKPPEYFVTSQAQNAEGGLPAGGSRAATG
jgi:hypothetical protein